MIAFPDPRIQDLLQIEWPIIQAPMAGADSVELAAGVAAAGGLGSLACAMLNEEQIRSRCEEFFRHRRASLNLNFFCHQTPSPDPQKEAAWQERLKPFYDEEGLSLDEIPAAPPRRPFDEKACDLIEEIRPAVVSFHFGLPEAALLSRVKKTGARVLGCATSVEEARWLENRGCDLIIAQGFEAGGHRGSFLNLNPATQVGSLVLLPQIVRAVQVPVIVAGGIADGRGIAAALILGALAVQIGTAYLFCPEAKISAIHRQSLKKLRADETVITNVFSGRPARGIKNRLVEELGILAPEAPAFPLAATAIAALRKKSEERGSPDFAQMWAGQNAAAGREMGAEELTRLWVQETRACLDSCAQR